MEKIVLVFLVLLICGSVYAADQVITLTIPNEDIARATEGFLYLYPNNETVPDPNWVDPKDGTMAPQIAKYSDKAWIKEQVRRILVRDIHRGLQKKANDTARIAINDNTAK